MVDATYRATRYHDHEGRCAGCGGQLHGRRRTLIVWLAGADDEARPYHEACANQPWPLYEVDSPRPRPRSGVR